MVSRDIGGYTMLRTIIGLLAFFFLCVQLIWLVSDLKDSPDKEKMRYELVSKKLDQPESSILLETYKGADDSYKALTNQGTYIINYDKEYTKIKHIVKVGDEKRKSEAEENIKKGLIVDKKINVWTEHEIDYLVAPVMFGNSMPGMTLTPSFQSEEKMELTLRVYSEGEILTLVVDEDVYQSYKQGDNVLLRFKNNNVEIKGD